jgi:hypothetical protein
LPTFTRPALRLQFVEFENVAALDQHHAPTDPSSPLPFPRAASVVGIRRIGMKYFGFTRLMISFTLPGWHGCRRTGGDERRHR